MIDHIEYDSEIRHHLDLRHLDTVALLLIARGVESGSRDLHFIAQYLREIRDILKLHPNHQPDRSEITIMPKSIVAGSTSTAHIVATLKGNPFVLTSADAVALVAAVPGDVTFAAPVFNADGSCDIVITGINADAGDSITATVDGITSNADILTITAAGPDAVTLTLQ